MNDKRPELLAPAGDWECFEAALEAGADAVYLGLDVLNARRLAKNFHAEQLGEVVQLAHNRGVKVYLTLNTDITNRELGIAARALWLAEQVGVDGVLVRDPATLALAGALKKLPLHFSTQAASASSADVAAAKALGITRVVLAREMTLSEIRAATRAADIETEVFVQGAMCFSISGRCLLSSWIGGRSGNRGLCASPCRAVWEDNQFSGTTPFSMSDLGAASCLDQLAGAGVTALKIEGRMKNAAWVKEAVSIYREALLGKSADELGHRAEQLGRYAGRPVCTGFLEGIPDSITGTYGRPASSHSVAGAERLSDAATFELSVEITDSGIECTCTCGTRTESWRMPKTVVRRPKKAIRLGDLLESIEQTEFHGSAAGTIQTNAPDFLLVPRAANNLVRQVGAVVHRARRHNQPSITKLDIPPHVRELLKPPRPAPANNRPLGSTPNRVRICAQQVEQFRANAVVEELVVEGLRARNLAHYVRVVQPGRLIAALPSVMFEEDLPEIRALLERCRELDITVEVNNWGGWWLARQFGLEMEAGPGLGVLNWLAAKQLGQLGIATVTVSIEADRHQMEDLSQTSPVPLSLVVYGRPVLSLSRVPLPESLVGRTLHDQRGNAVRITKHGKLLALRPVNPFDLRDVWNERIRVANLVVDLTGSDDPVADFFSQPSRRSSIFRFNYDRRLR